jgi:hypothetical protein
MQKNDELEWPYGAIFFALMIFDNLGVGCA